MVIKEIGMCGVVVVGGAVYGISQGGLGDALSSDLRAYHEVSDAERAEYMQSVVGEFSETFEIYQVQTETYIYTGHSTFSSQPLRGLFEEVVTQEEIVPKKELAGLKARLEKDAFCAQEEMLMITDKGWNYRFKIKHGNGRSIATIICQPQRNPGTA